MPDKNITVSGDSTGGYTFSGDSNSAGDVTVGPSTAAVKITFTRDASVSWQFVSPYVDFIDEEDPDRRRQPRIPGVLSLIAGQTNESTVTINDVNSQAPGSSHEYKYTLYVDGGDNIDPRIRNDGD